MTMPTRPHPANELDQRRWEIAARRFRMLEGLWRGDAEDHLSTFFHETVTAFLPPAETSRNPLKSFLAQLNVVYDEDPPVTAEGVSDPEALAPILTEELWPLAQQRQLQTLGINECLMRVDLNADGSLSYRLVHSHDVANVRPHPKPTRFTKGQPGALEELRYDPRQGVWYWEVWDVTGETPVYRKDYVKDSERTPGPAEPWPEGFTDRAGQPVMPYVLYHREVGAALFSPDRGSELVYGTLTTAMLWTMWLGGFRDGAHPQRWSLDAEVSGVKTKTGQGTDDGYIVANPLAILPFRSKKQDRPGTLGQFAPAMDPKTAGEAVEQFVAGLAIEWGMSPADITVGSSQQSGYAIVVSRDGQRKSHRRQRVPASMGDRLLLATAARVYNKAHAGQLPEDPAAYAVAYAPVSMSAHERKAVTDDVTAQVEAGLLNPVDGVMRLHPEMSREQAAQYLTDIHSTQALLKAATTPADQVATLQALTASNLLQVDPKSYFYNLQRVGLLHPSTDIDALVRQQQQAPPPTPAPEPPAEE